MTASFDFLVVGGGPSGSTFATLAARAGASVCLVERSNYASRRVGEYLSGRIRGALDTLMIPVDDARTIFAASPGIISLWNSFIPVAKPHRADGQPNALCVTRNRFDELLFNCAGNAGVTTVSNAAIYAIERESASGWKAILHNGSDETRSIRAHSVVDATGRKSLIGRSQGARREHCGDLIAIVGWLECGDVSLRPVAMLTVESSAYGWWSLSTGPNGLMSATFYTSLEVMKSVTTNPEQWWARALDDSRGVKQTLYEADAVLVEVGVFSAFPSRLSKVAGDGWIAIGDAAVAFDPIAGRGVATAIDTAFRAFEAATVDPLWGRTGGLYQDALIDKFERHLSGRAGVYNEASSVFSDAFMRAAVMGESPRERATTIV